MSVYLIVDITVLDATLYGEYINRVPETVKKYGGRYLARGGRVISLSELWHPDRIVILEFPSWEKFAKWQDSEEYRKLAPLRINSTISKAIVVEGFSET